MRRPFILPAVSLLLSAAILACGGTPEPSAPPSPPDAVWLELLSTGPAHGATGVARAVTVSATFSDQLDPATVNAGTFMVFQEATLVPVDISVTGNIAWLTPRQSLDFSTTYTVRLTEKVQDTASHRLQRGYNWEFTTKSR